MFKTITRIFDRGGIDQYANFPTNGGPLNMQNLNHHLNEIHSGVIERNGIRIDRFRSRPDETFPMKGEPK